MNYWPTYVRERTSAPNNQPSPLGWVRWQHRLPCTGVSCPIGTATADGHGTDAEGARAADHAADVERTARAVARETTFSVLYRLADPDSDDEQPRSAWYTYPLVGRNRVDLHIARSVGGTEVSVSVQGTVASRVRTRVELLLDIMARYGVVDDSSVHRRR